MARKQEEAVAKDLEAAAMAEEEVKQEEGRQVAKLASSREQ